MAQRIGVFICHCGINIAGIVDVSKAVEEVSHYPGVAFASDYTYMCSEPGQDMISTAIKEHDLDAIVVAACSPMMHRPTFRRVAERSGINKYTSDMANIREQCSWVHKETPEKATSKAITLIKAMVEKVRGNEPLVPVKLPITKKALVIGGGIAGIQASLDIADSGFQVFIVEQDPSIGGHMAQLSETFPTLDCSSCILTPKTTVTGQHENITILANSSVEKLEGSIGDFKATVRTRATKVDSNKCTGCGLCTQKCPVKVPSEFDRGLSKRKAIYTVFPQAVPRKAVLDTKNCIRFTKGKCGACEKVCPANAVVYDQEDTVQEIDIGAVIIATGYDLIPISELEEYGGGRIPNVIDGLQFERLLSASGPTYGQIKRPSDGKVPKSIAFIQCSGSRDPEHHRSYCSKICCMYTAKQALLYKHKVPQGDAQIFYIDLRTSGKGYEEFAQKAIEENCLLYHRGKASKIYEEGDKIVVRGLDTTTGREIEAAVDMVVLALATMPSKSSKELMQRLKLGVDKDGWLIEAHSKMSPNQTKTGGIFLAGTCQGPKDISETVAHASGAAAKVIGLLTKKELESFIAVAEVDPSKCRGCGRCEEACEFNAITVSTVKLDEGGVVLKAQVNEATCLGCGKCSTICCNKAINLKNFRTDQIKDMIQAILDLPA